MILAPVQLRLSLVLRVIVVGLALGLLPQAFARLLAVGLFAVRLPGILRPGFEGLSACAAPPFFHGETPFEVGFDMTCSWCGRLPACTWRTKRLTQEAPSPYQGV